MGGDRRTETGCVVCRWVEITVQYEEHIHRAAVYGLLKSYKW